MSLTHKVSNLSLCQGLVPLPLVRGFICWQAPQALVRGSHILPSMAATSSRNSFAYNLVPTICCNQPLQPLSLYSHSSCGVVATITASSASSTALPQMQAAHNQQLQTWSLFGATAVQSEEPPYNPRAPPQIPLPHTSAAHKAATSRRHIHIIDILKRLGLRRPARHQLQLPSLRVERGVFAEGQEQPRNAAPQPIQRLGGASPAGHTKAQHMNCRRALTCFALQSILERHASCSNSTAQAPK